MSKRRLWSFCEAVTAGPRSPLHIRPLTDAGQKMGGGADTNALCGRQIAPFGWDVDEPAAVERKWRDDYVCRGCAVVFGGTP